MEVEQKKKLIKITLSDKVEITQEKDLFELMNENLSDEELLNYVKTCELSLSDILTDDTSKLRDMLYPNFQLIEKLITEIMTWDEFIPALLNAHLHGDLDLRALVKKELVEIRPMSRYDFALHKNQL